MARQPIFKEKYIQKLKDHLNTEFYLGKEFIFDRNQLLIAPHIEQPEGLSERLLTNIEDDLGNAIHLYEAFQNLHPIEASDERLWTFLCHVDLYSYMIKRWNGLQNNTVKDAKEYILEHWFLNSPVQSNLLRHPLAGLWWAVYLSTDKTKSDPYELTRILFRQLDFPTRTLGTYKLGRHKEAVIGILEFIRDEDELFKHRFQDKTRFITKHLNFIGGVKPISYYDREFFKRELRKVSHEIALI